LNNEKWEYGTLSLYATEMLFGIILILSLIFFISKLTKQSLRWSAVKGRRLVSLVLLVLLVSLSCALAVNPEIALYKFTHLILAAALFAVIVVMKIDWQKISWAIIISGLFQAGIAIQQFASQKVLANKWFGMAEQNPETLGVPVVQLENLRWLRSFGTLPHPNILAGFLVIGLILIIGLIASLKQKKLQKILRLIFVINFIGLLTTLSRAAIITLVVSIIVFAFISRKDKILNKTVTKFSLIVFFILIIFTVSFPELILTRTLGNNRVENISNVTRVEQYKEAGSILKDNWLIGVGLGNYTTHLYNQDSTKSAWDYQPVHNTYLLIFAELGIVGLAAGLFFIGYLLFYLFKSENWSTERLTGLACLAGLASLAFFDHYLWSFYFGIILFAIVLSLIKTNNSKNV